MQNVARTSPRQIYLKLVVLLVASAWAADPPPPPAPPARPPASNPPPCNANNTARPFQAGTPCANPTAPAPAQVPTPAPSSETLSPRATLGEKIFNDRSLSASGKQSCATCHDEKNAWTAPNNLAVQLGGQGLNLQGPRAVPGLSYLSFTPPFALNPTGNGGQPRPPHGGFLLDGRAATLVVQAQLPFLAPFEMANKSAAEVQQRLRQAAYFAEFKQVFGDAALNTPEATLLALGQAIAAYETEDTDFRPFDSKYDAMVKGQVGLTPAEQRGLTLFVNQNKGNCASCHSAAPAQGRPALFTNHSFHNLGVPRNWQIGYNRDDNVLPNYLTPNGFNLGAPNHAYYDLGLCGPFRTDLSRNINLCGSFKTPTLRNIALKQAYFHNGVLGSLQDVVSFYATRDTNPGRWYKKADGTPDQRYNDLPATYVANVQQRGAPFDAGPRNPPTLNEAEVRDLVSFMCTLTDGFDPKNPAAYRVPAQCQPQVR